jgi:hypothetical protein
MFYSITSSARASSDDDEVRPTNRIDDAFRAGRLRLELWVAPCSMGLASVHPLVEWPLFECTAPSWANTSSLQLVSTRVAKRQSGLQATTEIVGLFAAHLITEQSIPATAAG